MVVAVAAVALLVELWHVAVLAVFPQVAVGFAEASRCSEAVLQEHPDWDVHEGPGQQVDSAGHASLQR